MVIVIANNFAAIFQSACMPNSPPSQRDYVNLTSGRRPLCQYYVVSQTAASGRHQKDVVNRAQVMRMSEACGLWANTGQAQQLDASCCAWPVWQPIAFCWPPFSISNLFMCFGVPTFSPTFSGLSLNSVSHPVFFRKSSKPITQLIDDCNSPVRRKLLDKHSKVASVFEGWIGVVVTALNTSTKLYKLRPAWLILGLVTTSDGYGIPYRYSSRPT